MIREKTSDVLISLRTKYIAVGCIYVNSFLVMRTIVTLEAVLFIVASQTRLTMFSHSFCETWIQTRSTIPGAF